MAERAVGGEAGVVEMRKSELPLLLARVVGMEYDALGNA